MKKFLTIAVLLLAANMINAQSEEFGPFECEEPRPNGMCYKILRPVLGVTGNGNYREYSNDCLACSKYCVDHYYNLNTCPDNVVNTDWCMMVRLAPKDLCAVNYDGTLSDYLNICQTCRENKNTKYYFEGKCPTGRKL